MEQAPAKSQEPCVELPLRELRPPLKWAGGKRWLLPHLKLIWVNHSGRRLVEPFCGGLAVAIGLMPEVAVLNDINPHLVNFYSSVKAGLRISMPLANDAEFYARYRNRFNGLIRENQWKTSEAATLFYYLNRTGYNGLCRFNRSGEFNVPFGKYRTINYATDFTDHAAVFAKWQFLNVDFEKVPVKKTDFIYADPPYDVPFTQYSKDGFTWDDQVRTAEWLAAHPGPVVLSNQSTPRIVQLYKQLGFALKYLQAPRMINCNGDRSKAREVLATKNI